jgi:hypothetical protein
VTLKFFNIFSEGASLDAPFFCAMIFSSFSDGASTDAPFGGSGEPPSEMTHLLTHRFSFRRLSSTQDSSPFD